MIHLDYRDTRPIYSQIIDSVKDQIAAGILQAGERLPSVRELAAQLAINPNTSCAPTGRWKATVGSSLCRERAALSQPTEIVRSRSGSGCWISWRKPALP